MDNILINFVADPSGLQPGIDGLVQLETVDAEVAAQSKKTMEAYRQRNKEVADGTKQSSSAVEKLTNNFKNLDKSIVGGAYKTTLKQLQKEIGNTGDEFKQLAIAIEFSKKKMAELKPDSAEWKELNEQVQAGEELLKAFGQQEGDTEKKTLSLRAELKALKQEIASKLEGGASQEEIQGLLDRAGELDDTLKDINATVANVGSDTKNLDGLISLAGGGIGVFSAFQGVIALTGNESKEFEQALLKLNGAMAVLQGLTQVQNVLQKESAATQLIVNAQRKIAVLHTQLQTAAESKNIIVRNAAIVAQRGLNAVMALSPTGALLLGIGAIASAMLYFSSSTKKAKVEVEDLNQAMEESIQRSDDLRKSFTTTGNSELDQLKRTIDARRAAGASEEELSALEIKAANRRNEIAKQRISINDGDAFIKDLDAFEKGTREQYNNLLALDQDIKKIDFDLSQATTQKEIDSLKKNRERVKSEFSLKKTEYDQNAADVKEYYESINDLQVSGNNQEKVNNENSLKSATAYAEARVLLAKRGSKSELDARVNAIRTSAKEELANVNLTEGEREKIVANTEKQIADLRFEFEKKALEDAKKAVDAKVLTAKEGSKEEFDFRLQSLQVARDIELKDQELTTNKRLEIEARFQKERETLTKAFNKKIAEDAINSRIAGLNSQNAALELEADAATNAKLLANKQNLINEEAALEVLSLQDSEKNEELRRVKIAAVYAKALADKRQLEKDKIKAEIDEGLGFATSTYNRLIAQNDLIVKNEKSSAKQKIAAQDEVFRLMQARIDAEALANQQAYDNGLISFQQYLAKKNELQTASDENDFNREQDHQTRLNQIRDLAQQTAINLVQFAQSISIKGYQREEEKIKELYDTKRITETEYNNRLKELKRKQAADEKALAVFTTLVNQGPAVIKGFQQGGFAGAAAAFALVFSLLAAVNSTDVPKFKKGKIRIDGPGTDTSDSILARISKNESVINATQSRKHEEALRAINEDRYHEYLVKHELPKYYQNMTMPVISDTINTTAHQPIDYDRLISGLASAIESMPRPGVSIDENGLKAFLMEGSSVTEYKNKKLNL